MTWHQVTSLFRSHPSAQALVGPWPALPRGANQSGTQGSPRDPYSSEQGKMTKLLRLFPWRQAVRGPGQWLEQPSLDPQCPAQRLTGWQKISDVVCSLLLQDTKYLPGLPNFSGTQFTVNSYLGYCQLKPEFSPHVLLRRLSLLWTCAVDFSLD